VDGLTGEILETGRMWGTWGDIPVMWVAFKCTLRDYVVLLRRLRAWGHGCHNRYAGRLTLMWQGWLVFCEGFDLVNLARGLDGFEFTG